MLSSFGNFNLSNPNKSSSSNGSTLISSPLLIDGNSGFISCSCTSAGDGSASNPWIIENILFLVNTSNALTIQNTNDHFIINNVTIMENNHVGITLSNVTNGIIANSSIYSSLYGISLSSVNSSRFEHNYTFNSSYDGFYVYQSYYNNFIANTANSNIDYGFFITDASNNTFSENIANKNGLYGFYLFGLSNHPKYNMLDSNIANYNNDTGYYIFYANNNTLINNYAEYNVKNGIIVSVIQSDYNNLTYNKFLENGPIAYNGDMLIQSSTTISFA